jgi:hypothetical protein
MKQFGVTSAAVQGSGKRRADVVLRTGYFVERSAKLFDEGASRRQIGEAPATIDSVTLGNASVAIFAAIRRAVAIEQPSNRC